MSGQIEEAFKLPKIGKLRVKSATHGRAFVEITIEDSKDTRGKPYSLDMVLKSAAGGKLKVRDEKDLANIVKAVEQAVSRAESLMADHKAEVLAVAAKAMLALT